MKQGVFAFSDEKFSTSIGLDEQEWEALLLVYRSASGETGFQNEVTGLEIIKWLLNNSATISRNGKLTLFVESDNIEHFFSSVIANGALTIHGPDDDFLKEVKFLAEYHKSSKIKEAYKRLGKEVELQSPPLLNSLFEPDLPYKNAIKWILSHSSRICVWNRFTEYGLHPTILENKFGNLESELTQQCSLLQIPFTMVSTERELPQW